MNTFFEYIDTGVKLYTALGTYVVLIALAYILYRYIGTFISNRLVERK